MTTRWLTMALGFGWLFAGAIAPMARAADDDGNGIDDGEEALLAEKFRPVLIMHGNDTEWMKPCPVGILGDGGPLTADRLWARVYNIQGQLVGVFRTVDGGWSPPPPFSYSTFKYNRFGWDQDAIDYIGSPPGAAFGHYFVRLYADFGGPGIDCPSEWNALYRQGDGSTPPSGTLPPTSYVRLFESGGEAILQYWFFYPYNDWINDHEGDWEHINLRVSSTVASTAELIEGCYFFHRHFVTRTAGALSVADGSHPVIWVGGDGHWSCTGCDDSNCPGSGLDGYGSHGSYPAPGWWADVGAQVPSCGAPDEELDRCGHRIHWADLETVVIPDPSTIDFDSEPGMSWLAADIPFGTPFVPSFCDDVCEFFDTFPLTAWLVPACANAAPHGPYFSGGWDRFEGADGFTSYSGGPGAPAPYVLDVPAGFSSPGDAAGCAIAGDTIVLAPGTYQGRVRLAGNTSILSSGGAAFTIWKASLLSSAIEPLTGAHGIRIGKPGEGFTFQWATPLMFPTEYVALPGEGDSFFAGNVAKLGALNGAVRIREGSGKVLLEQNRFEVPALFGTVGVTQQVVIGGNLGVGNEFMLGLVGGYGDLVCAGCDSVDARFNYWGSVEPEEVDSILAEVSSFVKYEPYTDSTHSKSYPVSVGVALPAESLDPPPEAPLIMARPEPTPTNSQVVVRFHTTEREEVRISIYDAVGRLRGVAIHHGRRAGWQSRSVSVADLPSGVYFCEVSSGVRRAIERLVIVR